MAMPAFWPVLATLLFVQVGWIGILPADAEFEQRKIVQIFAVV